MKCTLFLSSLFVSAITFAQQLQWHYDARHYFDPGHNAKNYPSIFFEYFKAQDSGTRWIKPGSFLLQAQADLAGPHNNLNKAYIQVSQSFRAWKPKIFLAFQYSGGIGITEPRQYSFYINNAYSVGLSYPFQWKGAWFNVLVTYTYHSFMKPSHDVLSSFYWGKGFWNYKVEFAGDINIYTLNKDQGDDLTKGLLGKWLALYGEPQLWLNVSKHFSAGSKINLYYHVLNFQDIFQVYPTLAARYKF